MVNRRAQKVDVNGNDKSPNGDSQALHGDFSSFAARLRIAAEKKGYKSATLAAAFGMTRGTMGRYWNGERLPAADALFEIADHLDISVDWLMRGDSVSKQRQLVAAGDAEWISVQEFDLRELDDGNKGPVISETPFRRDWLRHTLGSLKGIWLARLPAEYAPLGLAEGDLVFLRDADPDEPRDRAHYIVRIDGILTVARVDALAESGIMRSGDRIGEQVLAFRHFAQEEGRPHLVARVLGVPFKRI